MTESEVKRCGNCKYWPLSHDLMDCNAPNSTTWDANGNCTGWKPMNAVVKKVRFVNIGHGKPLPLDEEEIE